MPTDRQISVTGARQHVAATADALASAAALEIFDAGGSAVDAAIAANAVLSVTAPHLCGLGGDLFALVHTADGTEALNASGRSGSGSDAEQLRSSGLTEIPHRHHIAAVTVPGCVDGWITLSDRFGRIELATVLEPARRLAHEGFPASPLLVSALAELDHTAITRFTELLGAATATGAVVKRPGVARTLAAIGTSGRDAFYLGDFGTGLRDLSNGWITSEDLAHPQAEWQTTISVDLWGSQIHTLAPNSQGYLTLATLWLADRIGLPDDPTDPMWAHVLIESAVTASFDRPEVLHDQADPTELLARALGRVDQISTRSASRRPAPHADGDTTTVATADTEMTVSLIQSNAAGFGSWLVEPSTSINLHNRGIGFNLRPGHHGELAPRRRPPHTLAPAICVTRTSPASPVITAIGTMGGDAQPQIMAQLLTRILHHRLGPSASLDAPRWVLRRSNGFNTWQHRDAPSVVLEHRTPPSWARSLSDLGHDVVISPGPNGSFGHANIAQRNAGSLSAGADHRSVIGSAAGR